MFQWHEAEEAVLRGLVLDGRGKWRPIDQVLAEDGETRFHLARGEVFHDGTWQQLELSLRETHVMAPSAEPETLTKLPPQGDQAPLDTVFEAVDTKEAAQQSEEELLPTSDQVLSRLDDVASTEESADATNAKEPESSGPEPIPGPEPERAIIPAPPETVLVEVDFDGEDEDSSEEPSEIPTADAESGKGRTDYGDQGDTSAQKLSAKSAGAACSAGESGKAETLNEWEAAHSRKWVFLLIGGAVVTGVAVIVAILLIAL